MRASVLFLLIPALALAEEIGEPDDVTTGIYYAKPEQVSETLNWAAAKHWPGKGGDYSICCPRFSCRWRVAGV